MNPKLLLTASAFITLFALPSNAAITWVGTTSSDVFDESNWDLTGSSVTTIDENVSIDDDIFIGAGGGNAPIIPDLAGQVRFQIADGRMLTLDGGSLTVAGNDGVGGAPSTTNGPAVRVLGGSAFDPFFIVNGVSLSIDSSSSSSMAGGGNPINLSTVDLEPGASFTFTAETVAAFEGEHLSKFSVNGAAAVKDVNLSYVSDGANGVVITAVPEPSSALLAVLGGLSLALRRRR